MPKTPQELKEQVEREQAENPPADGQERTAEGLKVETPKRGDFFGNLKKLITKPD